MQNFFLFVLFLGHNFSVYSQDYIEIIIEKHLLFYYSEDSILMSDGNKINVSHDSLFILNEKKQVVKKYWEIDSAGKIINLYLEVTNNKLFVIQELDTDKRQYSLYKRKGSNKVVLYTWIDNEFEKTKSILTKQDLRSIKYFDGGSPF